MLAFLRDTGRRMAIALGFLLSALGAVAFVVPLPPLAGLPPDTVAGVVVAVGTGLLGWALWDQHSEIKSKDAALDHRTKVQAGLAEFRERLEQGNQVRRKITRWPRIETSVRSGPQHIIEKREETDRRMAAYREAVSDWKTACERTLNVHLSHRTPIFMQRLPAPPREYVTTVPKLGDLRNRAAIS